jgi:hypothetical protein
MEIMSTQPSETQTPRETAIQVLINGNGRFASTLEDLVNERNQIIRRASMELVKERDCAIAELAQLRAENERLREWQPITTNPEDFATVIIFPDSDGRVGFATYFPSEGFQSDYGREWPIYWFPLPAAPESKGGEGE